MLDGECLVFIHPAGSWVHAETAGGLIKPHVLKRQQHLEIAITKLEVTELSEEHFEEVTNDAVVVPPEQ